MSLSKTISHELLSYVGTVEIIPATVDISRFFTLFLTFFDLSIISAPTPISAAFKTNLLWVKVGSSLSAVVTPITSILLFFISFICIKESIPSYCNRNDAASTFLLPDGIICKTPSGLTGFNRDVGLKSL